MALPNIFDSQVVAQILARLDKLTYNTQPQWGKMNAPQMLAHLNVTYNLAYERVAVKNNFIMKFILKTFVKKAVVNEVSYPKNTRTAPVFIIADERDFEKEKAILIANLKDTAEKGARFFEGRVSVSFGPLTAIEWNNMFYKHIEHHFTQFGI